jgi:anti-sigma B factor antagonist
LLLVDLTETTFLDSSGARQLASSARSAARSGTALQVVCPPSTMPVRRVIDLLELGQVVPIVDSTASAEDETGA